MFRNLPDLVPAKLAAENGNCVNKVIAHVKLIGDTNIENMRNDINKIYVAYRRCWANDSTSDMLTKLNEVSLKDKVDFILKHANHESALEHITFTFSIEGISRVTSHQLVRHRISSISQQSQRVKSKNLNVIIPNTIVKNPEISSLYLFTFMTILKTYHTALDNGIPAEDARYILPNATETKLIMTFNIRSLMNFFNERLCTCAQWEIRDVANQMLQLVLQVYPDFKELFGPKCSKYGYCPESITSWEKCKRKPHKSTIFSNE